MKLLNLFYYLFLTLQIVACGTDTQSAASGNPISGTPPNTSGNSVTVTNSGGTSTAEKSSFFLRLTDAPIDNAAKVVITLLSVELIASGPDRSVLFEFTEPKVIDLLQLQGTQTIELLSNMEIDAGEYNEIRLVIDDSGMNSFIELSDGATHALKIPSGSTSGLKLKGSIVIPSNKPGKFTIDFDVRQSIVHAGKSSNYLLKPVLRIVDDSLVGHIRGTIDPALLTDASCSDTDIDTNNAVYVFQGNNIAVDDIDLSSELDVDPISTGVISYDNETDRYIFESAFLTAGNYTIAFTCNADQEDIESDNELFFFNTQNVTVQVNDIQFL